MEIRTKDIFAKIIANENIDVIESSYATTAAFDLEARKLILPQWQNVSDYLSRMLLAHEVSHAINTPPEGWFSAINSKPPEDQMYFKNILNVVEDVRIDRLIMIRYPGLKSDYRFAMRELNERGFFGGFGTGHFLSRLNTHLKFNISGQNNVAIPFNAIELPLMEEAVKVETWNDVVIVSEKIFALIPPRPPQEGEDEGCGYNKELVNGPSTNPIDHGLDIEDEVEKAEGGTFTIPPYHNFKNAIIQGRKDFIDQKIIIPDRRNVQKLRTLYNRKKSAMKLRERFHRKLGNIDTNSLHRYKPTGDIFGKEMISPKQKNHIIIVLVDGSLSMKKEMPAVAQKIYEIYEFCRLEKIPFMCYQFREAEGYLPNIRKELGGYKLYQYFNRNKAAIDLTLLANSADGGTPFCDSLLAIFPIMEEARKKYSESKITFISMTDGACNSTGTVYENYCHPVYKTTLKTGYSCSDKLDSSKALFKLLRDIYDCKVVSFHLNHVKDSGIQTFHEHGGANIHYSIEINRLKKENSQEETKILESFIETIS